MRSDKNQPDLLRNSDAALAEAHRTAAVYAMLNPYENMTERERRAKWHQEEAKRYETLLQHTK